MSIRCPANNGGSRVNDIVSQVHSTALRDGEGVITINGSHGIALGY